MTAAKTKVSPKKTVAKKAVAKETTAKRIAAKKPVTKSAAPKNATRARVTKSRTKSSDEILVKPVSKTSARKPAPKNPPAAPAAKSLTITLSKPAPGSEPTKTAQSSPQPAKDPRAIRIVDTPGITEQFANQVLDVLLVNGHTVSLTFGAKRTFRENTFGNQETVIAVNSRLTLDLAAAEALLSALNTVLNIAKNPVAKPPQVTLN